MKSASIVRDFVKTYCSTGVVSRLFLGFTCGVPFLLRLAVLDLWLKEYHVSNTVVGLFTLLHWPFTLKFLWAPFIEKMDFPLLSKALGRRRGWAVASQILLFLGLIGMATTTPETDIASLMFYTSLVAFADGCQDISLYAFQFDRAKTKMLGPIAGIFVFGYKVGMFFSKSATLYLAHYFGWNFAYLSMAFSTFLCTIFVFCVKEPEIHETKEAKRIKKMVMLYKKNEKSKFQCIHIIKATIFECLICPFKIFMKHKDWIATILVVTMFRAGDRMAQKMAKPFYVDMGFSLLEIANVVQVFGTIAALVGGIIGGYFVKLIGIKKAMLYSGIIHALGCFSYVALSCVGHNIKMLYITVFIENTTCGILATVFIAFLYGLCNKNYATTQYALLWAFCELGGIICRTISGIIADSLGWTNFFLLIPFIFFPSLVILYSMMNREKKKKLI